MTKNDNDAGSARDGSTTGRSDRDGGPASDDDGPAVDAADAGETAVEAPDPSEPDAGDNYERQFGERYIESTIIMTTVRVIAPFVMTFGLFITLHGADSPGGGFQGGVILASVLVMIAFAYGTAPTRDWINPTAIGGLIGGGVLLFAAIGLGSLLLGGTFLEYLAYGGPTVSKYSIELVELGIGATVVGVVTSIFFVLSRGYEPAADGGETE